MRLNSLRTKIVLAIIVVGSLPLLAVYLMIFVTGTEELRRSLGKNFQGLAQETASKTDLVMAKEFSDLRELAATEAVRRAVEQANAVYLKRSPAAIRRRLAEVSRDPRAFNMMRDQIVFNQTAAVLREHRRAEPESSGRLSILVTDAHGVAVAATETPPAVLYRGADWWEAAWHAPAGQPTLSNVYYDDRIKSLAFRAAIAIRTTRSGRPIGVLAAEFDAKAFFRPSIHVIRFGRTGHAMLIDGEGIVIICPILPTGAHITDLPLLRDVTGQAPGWVLAANDAHGGRDSIVGFAPAMEVNTVAAFSGSKRWHSFIRQDPKELYAPIRTLLVDGSIAGGLLLGTLVLMGLVVSARLTTPIERLRAHAESVGRGQLDRTLTVRTGDEIQALAEEFNRMAARLKESHATLEHKVEDRTRELVTLNTIAMTVNESLDSQRIVETVLAQVMKALRLEAVAVRLWDPDRKQLLYRAASGFPEDYLRGREQVAPAGTISGQVFHSGDPIVIPNTQEDARVNPMMRRLGIQAVACVPIKVKDRILGTLTVAGRSPRPFSDPDVALLLSIGAQIGTAVENAALYAGAQAAVEQLKEADRLKSQFLSSVSHELRTPLTAIIGFTELLLDEVGERLTPDQAHHLEGLRVSSEHLRQIINDLLDLAKLRAGKVELRQEACDAREILREAEQTIRPLATKKQQQVKTLVAGALPPLQADAAKIRQVLLNLLSNSVKFTPQGGTIRLEARAATLNEQPAIEFLVRDTGIGITAENLEKVFDEFRQIARAGTSDTPGTGLGLAISQRLVELHGGRIWAVSQPGKGSTFTFTIPVGSIPADRQEVPA